MSDTHKAPGPFKPFSNSSTSFNPDVAEEEVWEWFQDEARGVIEMNQDRNLRVHVSIKYCVIDMDKDE